MDMNRGDRVRVKKLGNVERSFQNRTGTVAADNEPGETVLVDFDDEAVSHQFVEEDLDLIT
jgi:hypothetical protein